MSGVRQFWDSDRGWTRADGYELGLREHNDEKLPGGPRRGSTTPLRIADGCILASAKVRSLLCSSPLVVIAIVIVVISKPD
jgi:hypothetical protein